MFSWNHQDQSIWIFLCLWIPAPAYGGYHGLAAPYHGAGKCSRETIKIDRLTLLIAAYSGYGSAYHGAYASPIVKTAAIAHHPVATSYSNSVAHHIPVAAHYGGAYSAGYGYAHAPVAKVIAAPYAHSGYGPAYSAGYGLAAPAYAGYAHGPSYASYHH